MAIQASSCWLLLINVVFSALIIRSHGSTGNVNDDKKVYIVYMGNPPDGSTSSSTLQNEHASLLQSVTGSEGSNSLVYSYKSFNAFAARLTKDQMQSFSGMDGVMSVIPNEMAKVHTTHSWDYMEMHENVERAPLESDIIVGVFDTGIWPESESFSDRGYGPPPKKWKGTCQKSENFTCNNKIIGARYYRSQGNISTPDIASPRDTEGHGTHTASTVAGNLVSKASLLGLAEGTSRGGVPSSRIAVYKVCWSDGCFMADILAAFDDAISDGVDIISISFGTGPQYYFVDSVAIGAFHAMKKGILTSFSAGNDGPDAGLASNLSPWAITVAASSTDRKFSTTIKLGNGATYNGVSVNTFDLHQKMYPLIWAGDAPNVSAGYNSSLSRTCFFDNSLDERLVKGKIVYCDEASNTNPLVAAGAVGLISHDDTSIDTGFTYPLSASQISEAYGIAVSEYANKTRNPTATIFKSTTTTDKKSPYVSSFSSRGPNLATPDILKPDISAPGVDILASWSQVVTVTGLLGDKRISPYNILSGTSMACPHVSGAAAYVKSFYPHWSPAAIKSALMTTATVMTPNVNKEAEFAYGAGQINPVAARNPGLVYDAGEMDYVHFLCGQGYNATQLRHLTGHYRICTKDINSTVWDLNYPSFTLSGNASQTLTRVFHRTVTNVGSAKSTYVASVNASNGLKIEVKPNVLKFNSVLEKKTFIVTVVATMDKNITSGSLTWADSKSQIKVRSPVVAYKKDF